MNKDKLIEVLLDYQEDMRHHYRRCLKRGKSAESEYYSGKGTAIDDVLCFIKELSR